MVSRLLSLLLNSTCTHRVPQEASLIQYCNMTTSKPWVQSWPRKRWFTHTWGNRGLDTKPPHDQQMRKNRLALQRCKSALKQVFTITNSIKNLVVILKIFHQNDKKQAWSQGTKLLPSSPNKEQRLSISSKALYRKEFQQLLTDW